jgi:hypothetical protein
MPSSRVILGLIAVPLLAGCQSTLRERHNIKEAQLEVTHLVGVRQTWNVGDVLTASAGLGMQKTASVSTEIHSAHIHSNKPLKITAKPGPYRIRGEDATGYYYAAPEPMLYEGLSRPMPCYGGLYVPREGSGETMGLWFNFDERTVNALFEGHGMLISEAVAPLPKIDWQEKPVAIAVQGVVGTLSYAGVASNQIRFIYREFQHTEKFGIEQSYARPAFTQDVVLDFKPGQQYTYQKARLVVHEADSTHIVFTLLSPL